MKINKAIIAVAGYGTRFLPATKVMPKELLPIVDKPVAQYLAEEAVESGIKDIIFVTREGTKAIVDHFDSSHELETQLAEQQKPELLQMIQAIPRMANFEFVHQGSYLPYGNGAPILAAKDFIDKNEPFVYMFGDDLVLSQIPATKQLIDVYQKHQPSAVIAVQNVPQQETNRYGIVRLKPGTEPKEMESIIEKPSPDQAPSRLAQFGRFVLSWKVIEILEKREVGKGNELWLTDAIHKLSQKDRVLVQEIEGTWYTMGDPLRYLIANVEYALQHPGIGKAFADYLRNLKLPKP